VVAQLATRIAVMRQGEIVEIGPAADVLGHPAHPYTQSLVAARPNFPSHRAVFWAHEFARPLRGAARRLLLD